MSELDNKDMAESFENSIENDVEEYCPKEQFDKLARKMKLEKVFKNYRNITNQAKDGSYLILSWG